MNIQTPAFLNFEPRRLNSSGPTVEDQRKLLQAENPGFQRSVDLAQLGHSGMAAWTNLSHTALGRATSGAVALGAGVWGLNKVVRGKTALDRVEGVGDLALAAGKAIQAGGDHCPQGTLAAGLVQGGADLIVGGADTVRGLRENSKRRLTVGLCQMTIGACVGASVLVPSAAGVSTAIMWAAAAGRQIAIGFHTSLPD